MSLVPIIFIYFVSFLLVLFGIVGFFLQKKRSLIIGLVCLELLLVAYQLNTIINTFINDDILGEILIILVLNVAAAEVAIGLALLILYYRIRGSIASRHIYLLKGQK